MVATTVAAIDLLGPFKAGLRAVAQRLVDALTGVISTLLDLYVGLLGEFLYLEVDRLATLEGIWSAGLAVYVGGLCLVALGALGTMQVLPGASRLDPHRLGERALLATVGLVVVNPPGSGGGLFGDGAVAWAFALTNAIQRLYLRHASQTAIAFDVGSLGDATGTVFATAFAAGLLAIVLAVTILPAVLVLAVRQLTLFAVYALFPLLALLWIVDAGPLKYGHLVATMTFRAAGTLLVLGVLVSGVLAASVGILGASHGSSPGPTATDNLTRGPLAGSQTGSADSLAAGQPGARGTITTVIDVVGSALLVSSVTIVAMLGIVGSALDGG